MIHQTKTIQTSSYNYNLMAYSLFAKLFFTKHSNLPKFSPTMAKRSYYKVSVYVEFTFINTMLMFSPTLIYQCGLNCDTIVYMQKSFILLQWMFCRVCLGEALKHYRQSFSRWHHIDNSWMSRQPTRVERIDTRNTRPERWTRNQIVREE